MGGDEPQCGGDGMRAGKPQRDGGMQEGGEQGLPELRGRGAYEGGPLSWDVIDNQAPVSIEQQVEWPILFMAPLTFLDR